MHGQALVRLGIVDAPARRERAREPAPASREEVAEALPLAALGHAHGLRPVDGEPRPAAQGRLQAQFVDEGLEHGREGARTRDAGRRLGLVRGGEPRLEGGAAPGRGAAREPGRRGHEMVLELEVDPAAGVAVVVQDRHQGQAAGRRAAQRPAQRLSRRGVLDDRRRARHEDLLALAGDRVRPLALREPRVAPAGQGRRGVEVHETRPATRQEREHDEGRGPAVAALAHGVRAQTALAGRSGGERLRRGRVPATGETRQPLGTHRAQVAEACGDGPAPRAQALERRARAGEVLEGQPRPGEELAQPGIDGELQRVLAEPRARLADRAALQQALRRAGDRRALHEHARPRPP